MQNVMKIINIFGGMEKLKEGALKIKSGGFMPLSIESVGVGPNGLPAIAVAHYFEQNGDLCCDPDMCFELAMDGKLYPYSYQQDGGPCPTYQEVYCEVDGKKCVRLKVQKDLRSFASLWNKNIKNQGFVDAAKKQFAAGIRRAA